MTNLACPISNEKIAEHTPRLIAFFNITLIALYIYSSSTFVLAFLVIDFLFRGLGYGQYSLFMKSANYLSALLNIKSKPIDKAPKIFAARLGALMFSLAFVFAISGFQSITFGIVGLVGILSALESFAGICVGCYMYTFLVLPFFKMKKFNV